MIARYQLPTARFCKATGLHGGAVWLNAKALGKLAVGQAYDIDHARGRPGVCARGRHGCQDARSSLLGEANPLSLEPAASRLGLAGLVFMRRAMAPRLPFCTNSIRLYREYKGSGKGTIRDDE